MQKGLANEIINSDKIVTRTKLQNNLHMDNFHVRLDYSSDSIVLLLFRMFRHGRFYISILDNFLVCQFRMVPVHRVKQLHHFFIGPIWRQDKKLEKELRVEHDENWEGQIVPNVVPLKVRLQEQVAFNCGSTVKEVNKNKLVEFPHKQVGHFCLKEQPANTREWSGHFEEESYHSEIVSLAIVCCNASPNKTKTVVNCQKFVKALKDNS